MNKMTEKSKNDLWNACVNFIKDNEISHSSQISDNDYILENIDDFFAEICDIVGYHEGNYNYGSLEHSNNNEE